MLPQKHLKGAISMIFNIVHSTQKTLQRELQLARDTGKVAYAQRLEAI